MRHLFGKSTSNTFPAYFIPCMEKKIHMEGNLKCEPLDIIHTPFLWIKLNLQSTFYLDGIILSPNPIPPTPVLSRMTILYKSY